MQLSSETTISATLIEVCEGPCCYRCFPIGFFTIVQSWQCWHYCQLCIPTYLLFPSLFTYHDGNKYKIYIHWVQKNYISKLQFSYV